MSQKQRILRYLQDGHTLSRLISWEALGVLECPARVCELRREGYPIETKRKTVLNRYHEKVSVAEWRLTK